MRTLKAITQRFSMEYAIRAFIAQYPEKTLTHLGKWAKDKNYHVRRLVSESTRPLLPWAGRLPMDVARPLPFLDILHADASRYVTRSVANHLNDISKTRSQLVLETLARWQHAQQQHPVELQWMIKHAMRTLVKQGNVEALSILGFHSNPSIEVSDLRVCPISVRPGEAVEFWFTLVAQQHSFLLVDYVIDFVKANGSRSPKVHKLKVLRLRKGECVLLTKKHLFRRQATTLKYYPGTHRMTVQIKGRAWGAVEFELQGEQLD